MIFVQLISGTNARQARWYRKLRTFCGSTESQRLAHALVTRKSALAQNDRGVRLRRRGEAHFLLPAGGRRLGSDVEMNRRLDAITDWDQMAHVACYRPRVVAALASVSLRTLERFFMARFGCRPKRWTEEVALGKAIELMRCGEQVKKVSSEVGFSSASHFCRAFKRHYHVTCTEHAGRFGPAVAPQRARFQSLLR